MKEIVNMECIPGICGGNIAPISTVSGEQAWQITDIPVVLEYALAHGRIILGGDILDVRMNHNYDSWFYNIDKTLSEALNVQRSCDVALEYIQNYINWNGESYYVVLVVHSY